MASLNLKNYERHDKENTKVGPLLPKKDKNSFEEPAVRKTVLGEANSSVITVEEPSSPEDTRLLKRKR